VNSEDSAHAWDDSIDDKPQDKADDAIAHVPCAGFVPIEADGAITYVTCAGGVPIGVAHVPYATD
jgi:hypothetical protein